MKKYRLIEYRPDGHTAVTLSTIEELYNQQKIMQAGHLNYTYRIEEFEESIMDRVKSYEDACGVIKENLFDNILKDSFQNHNRLHIAAMAMQGLLSATSAERFTLRIKPEAIAEAAFEYADALISESQKGGKE